ncbi:MAG: hypothetical protein BMS9Abin37_0462 [Acidobacteriota bacterium]|nr:MAG: hypothetical protein BMS9Abin37_0462 [Acidobacteriota bacterium]
MLLGISKYDAAETASWLEENDWTFPLLCDGEPVIESYGLLNPDVARESMKGIPHPATIIIDKQGKVRFVNVWVDYRQRTSPKIIVEELKKIR